MTCRGCGADEVVLSRLRSRGELLLTLVLPVRYYRCHACNRRGLRVEWRFGLILEKAGLVVLAFLLGYTLLVLYKSPRPSPRRRGAFDRPAAVQVAQTGSSPASGTVGGPDRITA